LPNWASVKGARVNGATMAIGGKELRKGGVEVIRNKGGDDILFIIRDNKEVAGACCGKIVPPARTRENARLGTSRTGSALFSLSVPSFGF